jgi:hypothetical protein
LKALAFTDWRLSYTLDDGTGEDRLGGQRLAPERPARGHLRLDHPQRTT